MMHWSGWWSMGWVWIFWLFVVVGIVVVGLWATRSSHGHVGRNGAEETLKQRFARGEIDQEEYEEKLNALRH